jgi:hypothetical protein
VTTCSHGVVEVGDDSGCVACNHARGYQAGLAEGEARGRRAERSDVVAYYRAMSWSMTNGLEVAHAVEHGDHVNAAGEKK